MSELTARTNDDSFETAYSEWLKVSRLGPNDCLFAVIDRPTRLEAAGSDPAEYYVIQETA